ncbi:MAG TPA: RNA methyltransferase [Jatrophihabitans sp.]|nr:RNA methyltransferase [Jatrophihabitans sp.]
MLTAGLAADDPRLHDFRDLTDADVRPDRRGIVIAEGVNVVERLLRSADYRPRAIVGVPGKLAALAPALAGLQLPVYELDKWTLSELVGFRVTRGVLASADRPVERDPVELIAAGRRLVVLEAINDFENLGSIFRNCAAFGVDGVLLDPRCADPLYRRSVRVSMGNVFGVPFARLPQPWPAALELLPEHGVEVLALTPRPQAPALATLAPPARWAVLLGAEGPGLSEAALAHVRHWVRIPMAPGVDSVNVATAGAIALAHLTAQ